MQPLPFVEQIVIITGYGMGLGSGHYRRSVKLAKLIGLKASHFFCITSKQHLDWGESLHREKDILTLLPSNIQLVIFDMREPTAKTLRTLKKKKIHLLGFDLFDPLQKILPYFDYVINGIPSLASSKIANINTPHWLPNSKSIKKKKSSKKIVISLGHQEGDTIFYLLKHYQTISRHLKIENASLIIYLGKEYKDHVVEYKSKIKYMVEKLNGEIRSQGKSFFSDISNCFLFISHFGLSSLEALNAGIPTIFWNPSLYHHQLTKKHFPELILGYQNKLLKIPKLSLIKQKALECEKNLHLGEKYTLLPSLIRDVISWGKKNDLSPYPLYRRPQGNFYRNINHKWIEFEPFVKNKSLGMKPRAYNQEYFFQEYLTVYGKTYSEDKNNIYRLANNRLNEITKNITSGKLLDIGCALGYFLDKAKERGFETHGVEISNYGYQESNKKHLVFKGNFETIQLRDSYDVITMWYVIEHFQQILPILKKISAFQSTGGLLALSTPNAKGLIGRFSPNIFFQDSPTDHYYLFDPKSLKKAFEFVGYKLIKIKYTGIHYNRFKTLFPKLHRFLPLKVYPLVASMMGWGDTFEMYLKKY